MKIHEMPSVNMNPLVSMILPDAISNVNMEMKLPLILTEEAPAPPKKEMPQLIKLPSPAPIEEYPMNLSMNKESEPIDLSNEKHSKIVIESDDDLKIIENNQEQSVKQPNGNFNFSMQNPPKTETIMTDALISGFLPVRDLQVPSRILEPTMDLPMEILQSPNL
jgi:hypothetical protein